MDIGTLQRELKDETGNYNFPFRFTGNPTKGIESINAFADCIAFMWRTLQRELKANLPLNSNQL